MAPASEESVTAGLRGHPVSYFLSQYRGAGVALTPSSRARSVDRLRVLINFVFYTRRPLAGVMASWGVAGTHVRGLQAQEKLVSAVFSERQGRELLFQAPNQVLVVGKNSPQKMLRKNGKV